MIMGESMKQPDNPFCTRTASRRWLALSLLLLLTIGLRRAAAPPIALAQTPVQSRIQVSAEVFQAVTQRGAARVLILLDDQALRSAAAAQRPALVAELQQRVLGNLRADDFQRYRQYRYVAGVAGTLSAAGLAQLQAEPLVVAIQLDHPGQAHLEDSLPALGGHLVHNNDGITGKGVTVAVLDSGIDSDHPDLSAALIAQHCFTNGNCPPNATTESTLAEDVNGHGTHVAGVIASAGNVAGTGFAPDAKIVAVRVLDANGSGFVSDWIAGLDWVRANRATTPVQIVNLSLGTFALYPGNCDAQEPVLAAAISQLRAQGVTIFASSGNQGSSTRIAAPACNSGVIAVGATARYRYLSAEIRLQLASLCRSNHHVADNYLLHQQQQPARSSGPRCTACV
jgi:subtilisin family serine protease